MLFGNAYMRYFKHGANGIRGSFSVGKRLLPLMLAYGGLTMAGFMWLAPILPHALGDDDADTITVLHWLSPYMMILGAQAIAADSLTEAGFQTWRSGVNVARALLNIGLNLSLIPTDFLARGGLGNSHFR